jgi:hypothetical protein
MLGMSSLSALLANTTRESGVVIFEPFPTFSLTYFVPPREMQMPVLKLLSRLKTKICFVYE